MRWHYLSRGESPNLNNRDYMRCIVETHLQNGTPFYVIADCERNEKTLTGTIWYDIEDYTDIENEQFKVDKWCPIEDVLEFLNKQEDSDNTQIICNRPTKKQLDYIKIICEYLDMDLYIPKSKKDAFEWIARYSKRYKDQIELDSLEFGIGHEDAGDRI
jgi:hypothetical protein